jgi:hypothetical protein
MPRIVPGPIFKLRADGFVEMPPWAAELMFVFIIYLELPWVEIVACLKTIEQFRAHLDEYSLVYSFGVALCTQDPILSRLLLRAGTNWYLTIPPRLLALIDPDSSNVTFWSSLRGEHIRLIVLAIMDSFRHSDATFEMLWHTFRRWVDESRNEITALVCNSKSPRHTPNNNIAYSIPVLYSYTQTVSPALPW